MRVLIICVAAAVAPLAALAAAARPVSPAPARVAAIEDRAGALSQENSREGAPVLTVRGLLPGQSRQGTVTIRNTADTAQDMTLNGTAPVDQPASTGQVLSQAVRLRVEDVTASPARELYSGTLGALRSVPVGNLGEGAARTYRFTATLPEASPPLPGATTSIDYEWIGEEGSPSTGGGEGTGTTGGAGGAQESPTPGAQPGSPITRTPSPPRGADRRAPRAQVVVLDRRRVLSKRRVRIKVRCDEFCLLELRPALTAARSAYPLTVARLALPAGRWTSFSLPVSKATARRARRASGHGRRALALRSQVAARDAAGNVARTRTKTKVRP